MKLMKDLWKKREEVKQREGTCSR